jgi:hypothetical protein
MNKYEVHIEDIYNKEGSKKLFVEDINVYRAHKKGLNSTNALREEISRIIKDGKTVYTFKNGFCEE